MLKVMEHKLMMVVTASSLVLAMKLRSIDPDSLRILLLRSCHKANQILSLMLVEVSLYCPSLTVILLFQNLSMKLVAP